MKIQSAHRLWALALVCSATVLAVSAQELPTLYEHFYEGGLNTGLEAEGPTFKLNGKPLRIISGAIHYFRVHPSRWRDSLRKLRASGANAVETYTAWNLHEPQQDVFDFGEGGNDLSEFLNLKKFVQIAQEEDLLVLLRPGPYICSEFEYGGFPSWLLRDPQMHVRGAYPPFLNRVKIFFDQLLEQVHDLQFTRGGPIIGIQIENEYAYFDKRDEVYLEFLVNIYKTSGFEKTLLFTSDGAYRGGEGSLPGLLRTANFQGDAEGNLGALLEGQPDRPVMAMEFWTGWYDNWMDETHHTWRPDWFELELTTILDKFNGSVNFYMFQGGTNFAFTAGGSPAGDGNHHGIITSYDYDAILTEAADYTEKYEILARLAEQYAFPKLRKPERPTPKAKGSYGTVQPEKYLTYDQLIEQLPDSAKFKLNETVSMENLNMNGESGQSYGYIVHRIETSEAKNGSLYKASVVTDFASLIVDGQVDETSFSGEGNSGYWINREPEITLNFDANSPTSHVIDIMVENMARANSASDYEYATQRKGLYQGFIELDGRKQTSFDVFALEFKSAWVKSLSNFENVTGSTALKAPALVQSSFEVTGEILDTYLDLTGWHKGIVFVNGFNLGRYFKVGPQQRLYVPAGVLHRGINTLTVFEQLEIGSQFSFEPLPSIGK